MASLGPIRGAPTSGIGRSIKTRPPPINDYHNRIITSDFESDAPRFEYPNKTRSNLSLRKSEFMQTKDMLPSTNSQLNSRTRADSFCRPFD